MYHILLISEKMTNVCTNLGALGRYNDPHYNIHYFRRCYISTTVYRSSVVLSTVKRQFKTVWNIYRILALMCDFENCRKLSLVGQKTLIFRREELPVSGV